MPCSRIIATSIALPLAFATVPVQADEAGTPVELDEIEIQGETEMDPLLPGNMMSVDRGRIVAGKKSTTVALDEQPTFVEPNLRQIFSRLPGLLVSDQKVPSIYNVNYRGLGNPHESEFVGFFQDGIPLASDLFGYPTIYYLPPAQRVEQIEFIRGGSGLLYGPQIGPTINFVTRRADARAATEIQTDQSFGSDGFYSTYNELRGGNGTFGLMASFDLRQADGPRRNEDFEVNSSYFGASYVGIEDVRIGFDVNLYESDSGEAGRLSSSEFGIDRDLTKTPFNRVKIDRTIATLTWDQQLGADATFNARLWHSDQDRFSRRSAPFIDPGDEPATTNIDVQQFETWGLDARYAQAWGQDHALTVGTTLYRTDSPRTRHRSPDIRSDQQRPEDLVFEQDRVMSYGAVFVENLFRFGNLSIAPAARLERVNYDLFETVKRADLERDPVDVDQTESELLFGLGAMYQVGNVTEAYLNISESYRPQRFDDLANPNAELAAENGPDISLATNYEIGVRSSPLNGLLLDVSLFRINFEDRIEQIAVNVSDVVRVNSGDSRHEGLEFSVEYDLFAGGDTPASLVAFANGSLLDAEITRSINPALVGNTPGFAPDHLMRAGFIYGDERLNAALTATFVDDQFWQDSNASAGSGNGLIAAVIPSYEVVDLSMEYRLSDRWTLFGGVNNLLDENYYSRVRGDGIEPAAERTAYGGFRFAF